MNIPLIGDGKLLIGSGSSSFPTAANLTDGTGIVSTNGAGSISLANTGTTSKTKYYRGITPNTSRSSSGALASITLPANKAAVGDLIEIGGEIIIAQTSGTYTGDVNLVTGATTSSFYNAFSMATSSGTITFSFYAWMIPETSSNSFLASQCTGKASTGTTYADAHLNSGCSVDLTADATLGCSLTISGGSGTATQRMLWIKVTGA